jgi:hypothetical protein
VVIDRGYLQDDGMTGKRPEFEPIHRGRDFDFARVGRTLLSIAFDFDF